MSNIHLQIVQSSISRALLTHCRRHWSSYHAKETREFLSIIHGGSVDLVRDESSGIATVVIKNEKKKNAFSGAMLVQFSDIVEELENWSEGRAVIVRGAGGTFSSGGDLTMAKVLVENSQFTAMCKFMQNVLTRFYRLPLLSVAFIEGKALGGGAEVAIACDFRVFAKDSSIGFVESKLGVSPGWGGGLRLVEMIGRRQALRLLSSGDICSSEEAGLVGLADNCVANGSAGFDEMLAITRQFVSARSPLVQQAAKRVLINASTLDCDSKLDGESDVIDTLWNGPDHICALNSKVKFTVSKP